MTNIVSKSEFAEIMGVTPQMVTKWLQADRLVMTDNGKKVRVEESKARIEATKDPNRDDVSQRHAANRAWAGYQPEGETPTNPPASTPQDDKVSGSFQKSRAVKEHFAALTAKAEYEQRIGKLCETEDVKLAGADVGTVLRSALEIMPDQLAPQLAGVSDEERIYALLVEYVEGVLDDIARRLDETVGELSGG